MPQHFGYVAPNPAPRLVASGPAHLLRDLLHRSVPHPNSTSNLTDAISATSAARTATIFSAGTLGRPIAFPLLVPCARALTVLIIACVGGAFSADGGRTTTIEALARS
jgi:hypothetical protein